MGIPKLQLLHGESVLLSHHPWLQHSPNTNIAQLLSEFKLSLEVTFLPCC